jgi:glycosyltransferase involved in cell wall biosynthesis
MVSPELRTCFQPKHGVPFSEALNQIKPRISVIIPNFNHTQFISGAIQSVLSQGYCSREIIVVDDGSTDNSREVVAGFGRQVRYIWQENQGLAGARNTGIRAASGEFIGLLDADDQWLPGYLEKMLLLADQHPESALYYCSAQGMDQGGRGLPQVFGGPARPPQAMYQILLRANFLIPSTILIRRSVAIANGLFDQTLRSCEDWDFWLRILPEHEFIGSSECLVRYRLHGDSLSANPTGMQQATRQVIEKHFGPDDGRWPNWSWEKRRAYGGVYRYHLLTSVQREDDWGKGALFLRRALQVDPTLAEDLDLFYDLALGNQPPGFRGTSYQLNLKNNAAQISSLLFRVFDSTSTPDIEVMRRRAYGTAFFALGLVAYNTGRHSLSRHFFVRALRFRSDLLRDRRLAENLIKSLLPPSLLDKTKRFKSRLPHRSASNSLQ